MHKKGVKITLITCDSIETSSFSDFQVSELIKKQKVHNVKAEKYKKLLFKLSIWLFVFSVLSAVLSFIFPVLFIFAVILLFLSVFFLILSQVIPNYSFKLEPIFRIKVFDSASGKNKRSTELIHSKIFVIDEKIAFLGSANFTYSGFKTHYETRIKIQDIRAVNALSQEVERLYFSNELKDKGVDEW